MCLAMSNCNDKGTCNSSTGLCACNAGWKGADCSLAVIGLSNMSSAATVATTGPAWKTFQWDGDANETDVSLTFTTVYPIDIYVMMRADSDPNRYVYEWKYMNTSDDFVLESKYLSMLGGADGFSVTVYINAYNEKLNTLYDNTLTYMFTASAPTLVVQ